MEMVSKQEEDTSFEHKNLNVLRQQIFDLEDEIAQRIEKYEAKMNFERDSGITTGSAIINGTETTPELISVLQRRLEKMKETELVLAKEDTREKAGKIKEFARKAAVIAGMVIGSAVAREVVERKNTIAKTKEIPNTEVGIKPESL